MNGIEIRHITPCFQNEEQSIWEVFNGFRVSSAKILRIKKGRIFPGHHHAYNEITYLESGSIQYTFKSIFNFEEMDYLMKVGDIIYKAPFIVHMGEAMSDCVMWCFSECPFVSSDFNNLKP